MKLERGNIKKPSGNLLVYCHVRGENPVEPEATIIASNVFVSFLTQNDTLPVITFPPVGIESENQLKAKITEFPNVDILKLPNFEMPDDPMQAQDYIQTRLQDFHEIVNEYVEYCSQFLLKIEDSAEKPKNPPALPAGAADEDGMPPTSNALDGIRYLETMAQKIRRELKADAFHTAQDEQYRNFSKAWKEFALENPQYDFQNLVKFLKIKADKAGTIVELYFKKFRAIYFENYEEANEIKGQIAELESSLT